MNSFVPSRMIVRPFLEAGLSQVNPVEGQVAVRSGASQHLSWSKALFASPSLCDGLLCERPSPFLSR